MPRYKMTIAYDGTDFCGWQKQFPHADAVAPDAHGFKEGDPEAMESDSSPLSTRLASPTSDIPHPTSPIDDDRARRELRTVQAVVERAVRLVVREPVMVSGSSRTDSGVHARGQVASFKCSPMTAPEDALAPALSNIAADHDVAAPPEAKAARIGGWPIERGTMPLMRAINARLPSDVLVRSIEVVPDDFNPVAHTRAKGYSYTLWCAHHRPLWQRRGMLHLWHGMDVGAMRAAAAEIAGEHNFAAFAAAGHGRLSTVRTVFGCEVLEETIEDEEGIEAVGHEGIEAGWGWPRGLRGEAEGAVQKIVIRVWGNGFLWNMVRIIGGTLVEAGKGKCTPERVREALRTGDRRLAGPTLPPHGLCLEWIRYADAAGAAIR